jgi:hypothetical protein
MPRLERLKAVRLRRLSGMAESAVQDGRDENPVRHQVNIFFA